MKKIKLSDISNKNYRFNIIHPKIGDTGAWIEIKSSNCDEYFHKSWILAEKYKGTEQSPIEQLNDTGELLATIVTAWDEEFFEMECTTENVASVLSKFDMGWLRSQINTELSKDENFFSNALKSATKA